MDGAYVSKSQRWSVGSREHEELSGRAEELAEFNGRFLLTEARRKVLE